MSLGRALYESRCPPFTLSPWWSCSFRSRCGMLWWDVHNLKRMDHDLHQKEQKRSKNGCQMSHSKLISSYFFPPIKTEEFSCLWTIIRIQMRIQKGCHFPVSRFWPISCWWRYTVDVFQSWSKSSDLTGLHGASVGEKQKQRSYQTVTPLLLHW